MKRIYCYLKALIEYAKYGVLIPHSFVDVTEEKHDIFVTDNSFRIATGSYEHLNGERLIRNVTVVTSKCKCCGKEEQYWYESDTPVITKETIEYYS